MKNTKKTQINIDQKDFGTLCICAIRYCHGRQTYMPSLVRGIITEQINNISDNDLNIMFDDCDFQMKFDLFGDEKIDKPGWLQWRQFLEDEISKREKGDTL